jgi:hypothetical protein
VTSLTVECESTDLSALSALKSLHIVAQAEEEVWRKTGSQSISVTIETLNTVDSNELTHLSLVLEAPPPKQWGLLHEALDRPCFYNLVYLHVAVVLLGDPPARDYHQEMDVLADLPVFDFRRTVPECKQPEKHVQCCNCTEEALYYYAKRIAPNFESSWRPGSGIRASRTSEL